MTESTNDNSSKFWEFFEAEAAPRLAHRHRTFRKIFEYLDRVLGPVAIIETGCARQIDNWEGDGQSTVLFDKYISLRDAESTCFTVDISPSSVAACMKLVSNRVHVTQDDSVHFLNGLAKIFKENNRFASLIYLDSFDLDMNYWQPSAIHHLKELTALKPCISGDTLVVVDDCPLNANLMPDEDHKMQVIGHPTVGGKGRLVSEYAQAVGAECVFSEYQAGWVGF